MHLEACAGKKAAPVWLVGPPDASGGHIPEHHAAIRTPGCEVCGVDAVRVLVVRTCTDCATAVEGDACCGPVLKVLFNNLGQCNCFKWICGGAVMERVDKRQGCKHLARLGSS